MNKKSIIATLLAFLAMTGWAQSTKTVTIKGYSPALKDSTLVLAGTGTMATVVDTVQNGHFAFTLPVEELTVGLLSFIGEGCPNFSFSLMMKPDVTVKVTGTDCIYPLWKVESPIPEQQTLNRMTEHCRDVILEHIKIEQEKDWNKFDSINMVLVKQEMDILSSLPVDAASINKLSNIARMLKNMKDFPYMEQVKDLEKSFAARAPKGFEDQLAEIHNYVYPSPLLHVGDKYIDAELFDMQGNTHRLSEAFSGGRYVLLDFWGIGCGPCMMSEPEMREVYERLKGKLEIVGINQNTLYEWKEHEFSKRIVWKNWNDGKKGSSLTGRYCDMGAIPYYVLISPEGRILWKAVGYGPGWFLGMEETFNSPKQDNSSNLGFVVRKVEANADGTKVSFRNYTKKGYWFRIAKDSYLEANGKKYKLTAADGIKLDADNYPVINAFTAKEDYIGEINYSDFTLTFEPFETIPETFDFIEGDVEGAFVIRNISLR
ncbi:MAG: TlpA family protein disulfide reductase [Prevotella sp.]|nr:TlpA family protein disulfide reductase [Prevotella sp.]